MKGIFITLFLACTITITQAQDITTYKLPKDLAQFFLGSWSGDGEFASGKKIQANLTFSWSLDSCWLQSVHTDIPPNRYKAESMWGVDKYNGEFQAYVFDNFGGHRKFDSNGWKDNRLVLTTAVNYPSVGLVYQHFIYEKVDQDSLKMTYETSKDGISWKLGDYLIFKRK